MALNSLVLSLMLIQQAPANEQPTIHQEIAAARVADGEGVNQPQSDTIIVTGESATQKKQIIVGSRIPTKPWLIQGSVATNTGTPGFTPGSGMDPAGGYTRTVATRECRSDYDGLSPKACRALASGDAELASDNLEGALFWFRHVADHGNHYTPAVRLIGAKRIFAIGRDHKVPELRLEALLEMLTTDEMTEQEQITATRSAAALAMQLNKHFVAMWALKKTVELDPKDAQSLANLAILQRKTDNPEASATMQRAIAAQETAKQDVPKGWRDFVALPGGGEILEP